MRKVAKRLRNKLDSFSSEYKMITVSRDDLQQAVKELEWHNEEWSNPALI